MQRSLRLSRSCLLPLAATGFVLLSAVPVSAAEPSTRVFGSATAAVMGGIVAGPVGLVAGAVIGYALGPALTGKALVPRQRTARRATRRAPVAVAPPGSPPQVYGQAIYPQTSGGQPINLAQQVPAPGQVLVGQPTAYPQSSMQGQPVGATQAAQAYTSPGIAGRPASYAPVPLPMPLAPSGNYAAHAYKPQDGSQTPDPLH